MCFCHVQKVKCTTLKPIKCISNIYSNKFHRNCDFTYSYQLLVICIIFYQCFFAMICTLCSGQKCAFITSKSHSLTGRQVLEPVTSFIKINHDDIARKTSPHSVSIASVDCFYKQAAFVRKRKRLSYSNLWFWSLNVQHHHKRIAATTCSGATGESATVLPALLCPVCKMYEI